MGSEEDAHWAKSGTGREESWGRAGMGGATGEGGLGWVGVGLEVPAHSLLGSDPTAHQYR